VQYECSMNADLTRNAFETIIENNWMLKLYMYMYVYSVILIFCVKIVEKLI